MSGSTSYEMTAQDNVDAVSAYTHRQAGAIGWILLAIVSVGFWFELWRGTLANILAAGILPLVAIVGLLCLFWDYVLRERAIRRDFQQSSPMRSPIRLSWDAQAITFDTDKSHAVYPWGDFHRWEGSATTLLLFRDSSFFFPVPRRALPDGAFEEMVEALKAAGVRERGRRHSAQSNPISS